MTKLVAVMMGGLVCGAQIEAVADISRPEEIAQSPQVDAGGSSRRSFKRNKRAQEKS